MDFDSSLKYIVFLVLYIEILSFFFNPKIKIQMVLCAIIVTAIASIATVYDFNSNIQSNSIESMCNDPKAMCYYLVQSLPSFIKNSSQSSIVGYFIGFIGLFNILAMMYITAIEYETDFKLSDNNETVLQNVKIVIISIVFSVFVIGIISSIFFGGSLAIDTANGVINISDKIKSPKVLILMITYAFFASTYTFAETRRLYKIYVNNLFGS